MAGMRAALPDLRDEDVIGSPYCVRDYVVDPRFGDLAAAREALAARGLKLILDYVPNHVAPDHPWVPEHCIHGTEEDLERDPASWLRVGDAIVARGRDPYFPAWPDVVQLNAFSPALRAAVRELLRGLAEQCDGVRCDMAMLMTNEVFSRTWKRDAAGDRVLAGRDGRPSSCSSPRPTGTWSSRCMQQGFDYCYDKRLYDRLAHEDAASVRGHLQADCGLPGQAAALHREPRRAAGGADLRPAGAGGGGRDGHRAGRQALPRRPVRRAAHAHPGLPRARAGRGARSAAAALLLAAGRARGDRLAAARRPRPRPTSWPGRSPTTSSSSTSAPTDAWGRVQVAVDGDAHRPADRRGLRALRPGAPGRPAALGRSRLPSQSSS